MCWSGDRAKMVSPPLGGAVYRDHAQYPAFAPGTSEVVFGLWLYYSYCSEFPQLHIYPL